MTSMRLQAVAAAYAAWLLGVFVVFYVTYPEVGNPLQVAVLCGAIPAAAQVLLLGIEWRGLVAPVKLWFAYLLVILLSYVWNVADPQTAPTVGDVGVIPAAWTPLVYTLNAAFIVIIGTVVAGSPDTRLLRSIASYYAIIAAVFVVYVDLTGKMVWGRLYANGITSNVWGLMGLTVCLAALARRIGPVAIATFTAGMATILLASSREHLLAVFVSLVVVAALYYRDLNRARLVTVLLASCVVLIGTELLFDPYILRAMNYISSDILLLNDANRGVGSGFTGRTGIWKETIDLWSRSPIFGYGYRQHERFLQGAPAHSAYLAVLADTGLLGFVVYVTLLITSLTASWGIRDHRTRRFVVTTIVSYIIIGFFDRRTIDAGNPCSLFFLMCCSLALADQSLRRVAALGSRTLGGMSGAADRPATGPSVERQKATRASQIGDLSPQN
jgi:O-antigen ligase